LHIASCEPLPNSSNRNPERIPAQKIIRNKRYLTKQAVQGALHSGTRESARGWGIALWITLPSHHHYYYLVMMGKGRGRLTVVQWRNVDVDVDSGVELGPQLFVFIRHRINKV
jgi:hypothetical protein